MARRDSRDASDRTVLSCPISPSRRPSGRRHVGPIRSDAPSHGDHRLQPVAAPRRGGAARALLLTGGALGACGRAHEMKRRGSVESRDGRGAGCGPGTPHPPPDPGGIEGDETRSGRPSRVRGGTSDRTIVRHFAWCWRPPHVRARFGNATQDALQSPRRPAGR